MLCADHKGLCLGGEGSIFVLEPPVMLGMCTIIQMLCPTLLIEVMAHISKPLCYDYFSYCVKTVGMMGTN